MAKPRTCRRCGFDIQPRQDTHVSLTLKVRECAVDGSGDYRELSYGALYLCRPCWVLVDEAIAGPEASRV